MDYAQILASIKPSAAIVDKIESLKSQVQSSIESAAKKRGVDVVVVAGGSTAKGTFLQGDFDIDMFVRFKSSTKNISDELEFLLSDFITSHNIHLERVHGSRDYFNFSFQELFFEVVPTKYVEKISEVENVTDMSPLHVEWIHKHITPKIADDIRLAKQFCKSALVYGAESFINGVSGHVLDILLIHFGSFDAWIKEVSTWSGVVVIDTNKDHDDVFVSLNKSKLVSPLIVVDPVDKQRNAAAALSQEKFQLLIAKTKEFLESPSSEFFIIPKFDLEELQQQKKVDEVLFVLDATPLRGKKDVVATKLLKVFEHLKKQLYSYDFTLNSANWFYAGEISYLYFFLKKEILERVIVRDGPPIHLDADVKRFQEVHETTFIKDGRVCAHVNREFVDAFTALSTLIQRPYVKERVASISLKKYD